MDKIGRNLSKHWSLGWTGVFLLFSIVCSWADATSGVTLAWDPNSEPDLAGYILYYGLASGDYTESIDVGNVTTKEVTGLAEQTTFYFALTAYNTAGLESDFSNEVEYTVPSINEAPQADDLALETLEDEPLDFRLAATDPDADPLIFQIVDPPANGSLEGNGASFQYLPAANFWGNDQFTFKASDGDLESEVATVTIAVASVNDAPVAIDGRIETMEDTPASLVLAANDVEGDELKFALLAPPAHGSLGGTAPHLTYTPEANYSGADSFTFCANDAESQSGKGTITIEIIPDNDAPLAADGEAQTTEDTPVSIPLSGEDPDGDELEYVIVNPPQNGSLEETTLSIRIAEQMSVTSEPGTSPILVYTPDENFEGTDTFTYKTNDGNLDSSLATVTITVSPVNDPPAAVDLDLQTEEDVSVAVPLHAIDPEGDALVYEIVSPPQNGTLDGELPDVTYVPNPDFHGTETFSYKANDGALDSEEASVVISVQSVNDPPIANPDQWTSFANRQTSIPVSVLLENDEDVENDSLSIASLSPASSMNGSLTFDGTTIFYSPPQDFQGVDTFSYTVTDGDQNTSATVTLNVVPDQYELKLEPAGRSRDNQGMLLKVQGYPGLNYTLQYTEDLITWRDLRSASVEEQSEIAFEDPTADQGTMRFYRVVIDNSGN